MSKLIFFLLLIIFTLPSFASKNPEMKCEMNDGVFRVIRNNHVLQKKYFSDEEQSLITCNNKIAVAIMGNYFVISDGFSIKDEYIGIRQDESRLQLSVGEDVAGAIMGNYLVTVINGEIQKEFISINSDETRFKLALGSKMLVAIMGNYFIKVDENQIIKEYIPIFSKEDRYDVVAGTNTCGAIMGNYFVALINDEFIKEYAGISSQSDHFEIMAGNEVVAGIVDSYLLIADKNSFTKEYVGQYETFSMDMKDKVIAASVGPYFIVFDRSVRGLQKKYIGRTGEIIFNDEQKITLKTLSGSYQYDLIEHRFL